MKSVQRREQCWLKENLVWEKPPTVKSTPTTGPPKSKHLRAAAPQHSKQYCCWNVEKCIPMFGKPLMSNFFLEYEEFKQQYHFIDIGWIWWVTIQQIVDFSELIEGRVLPRYHIVATARHETGKEVRKCCDAMLQIEGFTQIPHIKGSVTKYFKERHDLAQLYFDMVECVLRRWDMFQFIWLTVCQSTVPNKLPCFWSFRFTRIFDNFEVKYLPLPESYNTNLNAPF